MENGPIYDPDSDLSDAPLVIPEKSWLSRNINSFVEKSASTIWGQFFMELLDQSLRIMEETTKWSIPQQARYLVRPLPWFLFLGLIITLRFVRLSLTILACIMGYETVTPKKMIYFMQRQRRSLRSLRLRGLKVIRQQEFEELKNQESNNMENANLLLRCVSYLKARPNRIIEQQMQHRLTENKKTKIDVKGDKIEGTQENSDCEDKEDYNLSLNELLEKYAIEDSDNDPDFVPNPDTLDLDSGSSSLDTSDEDTSSLSDESKSDEGIFDEKQQVTNKSNEKEMTAAAILPKSVANQNPVLRIKVADTNKNHTSSVPATIAEEHAKDTKNASKINETPSSSTQKSESTALNGNHEDKSKIGSDPFAKKSTKASGGASNNTNISTTQNANSKANTKSDLANGY